MNFSLNKLLSGILIFLTAAIIVLTAAFFIAGMRHPRKQAAQPRLPHALDAARSSLRKAKARWRLGGKSGDSTEGGPV